MLRKAQDAQGVERPLTKHTINLFEGQITKLQTLHPRLNASHAIRLLIDRHVSEVEAKAATMVPVPETTVEVEDLL
jgi:hypothetical protein